MKKAFMILIAAVALLAGCTLETPSEAVLTVEVGGGSTRSIDRAGLGDVSMITERYTVSIYNQDKDITYPVSEMAAKNGSVKTTVATGKTIVTVAAFNAKGERIGSGSSTVTVLPNEENRVSVSVTEDIGKASLSVKVTTSLTGTALSAWITKPGSDQVTKVALSGAEGILSGSVELDTGFYLIVIRDAEGNAYGKVESFRVVKGYDMTFTAEIEDRSSVTVSITNSIPPTPIITITPEGPTTLTEGDAYSFTAHVIDMTDPVFTWYIDGETISSAKGATVSGTLPEGRLSEGKHTLTVIAESGSIIWSENREITIVKKSVDPGTPEAEKGITVSTEAIDADHAGGNSTFTVTRKTQDSLYEVTEDADWITVSKSTEGLVDTWTVTVARNDHSSTRTADITVGTNTVKVTQTGRAKGTSLSVSSLGFTADGGTKTFSVTKNTSDSDYSVNGAPEWAAVSMTGSDGLVDTWSVKVQANGTGAERSAVLNVGNGKVSITQEKKSEAVVPGGIEKIEPGSVVFPDSSASEIVLTVTKITPETQYEAVPGADWISVVKTESGDRTEKWTLSVEENTSSSDRKSSVSFGTVTVPVAQGGKYTGPAAPESVVIDSITPEFDGTNFWLDTTYRIHAHVAPLGASQELVFSIDSLGTGHGSGSQNRYVDGRTLPSFIEFDAQNGTVKPFELGDSYWSRDYRVTVSSKADPSVSAHVDFTIGKDSRAGISSLSQQNFSLKSHEKTALTVEVQKRTAGSTQVSWTGDVWLAASRKAVSENGLTETWEIAVGPNRTRNDRTGHIAFSANGTKFTVDVVQPGDPMPERHTEWVYGVVPPEESEYVRDPNVSPEYFEIYERKDIDQGWYLATKSQLSGQDRYNQDQNMCWAYSATNLIHWWAEHNSAYIDAFRRVHPEADINIVYDKNAPYVKDKSTVMPWFLARHGNSGGHPNVALLDMLVRPRHTGKGENNDGIWADLPNRTYPGWFNEVFRGHENEIVEVSGVSTKKDFHDAVERALLLDKGIGLNIHYYNVRIEGGYHAVNIWGFTYDENGEIVEVVIGDNNLNSSRIDEPNLAYLTNYKVTYAEGRPINDKTESEVEFWNTGVTESSEKKAMGCINQLVFLDLGTELWDDWMAENGQTF